jgi:hypothetical protein
MSDDIEWTAEDQKGYWDDVDALAEWFLDFLEREFQQVHAGSGDTLSMLEGLRERIEKEGLESVANFGVPETTLWEEEYSEKYRAVCDVVERTYQKMPLIDEDDPFLHTSKEARAAAMRIFEMLGIEARGDGIDLSD